MSATRPIQPSIYGQATLVKLSSNWTSLSRLFQTMKFQLNHEKTICNKEKGPLRGKAHHLERPPPTDAMPSTVMGTVTIQPILNMNSWTIPSSRRPIMPLGLSLQSPSVPQSLLVILVHSADVLRHLHPCGPP